jgi:RND superfamily putative drug exporter
MRRTPMTERLARLCARKPWLTIAAWIAIVIAAGGLLVAFGDSLQAADDFIGHPESKRAEELLAERLPGADADTEVLVVRSATLTVDDPAFEARVRDLAGSIRALVPQDVRGAVTWYDAQTAAKAAAEGAAGNASAEKAAAAAAAQAAALVSADRHTTIIPVTMAAPAGAVDEHIDGIYDLAQSADGKDGFTVVLTGSGAWERDAASVAESDLRRGEAIGIPIALVILIIVFASVVAALVPMALGVVAIVVGAALTALLGEGFMISVFALNIVMMMGLAVGIDYSLFIVSRFREERAAAARCPTQSGGPRPPRAVPSSSAA